MSVFSLTLYTSLQFTPWVYFSTKNAQNPKVAQLVNKKEMTYYTDKTYVAPSEYMQNNFYSPPELTAVVEKYSPIFEVKSENVQVVLCDQLEINSYGSATSQMGGAVKLPLFSLWKSESEVDMAKLKRLGAIFGVVPVDKNLLSPEERKELTSLLVLSEREREFAIAEHMAELSFNQHIAIPAISALPSFVIGFVVLLSNERRRVLYTVPQGMRAVSHIFVMALALAMTLHLALKRATEIEEEKIKMIIGLGKESVEAGIEFYEGALARGKLFRKALPFGDYYYDEDGEEYPGMFSLDSKDTTRKRKLERLRMALKEMEEGKLIAEE